jgi:hypothetical protein
MVLSSLLYRDVVGWAEREAEVLVEEYDLDVDLSYVNWRASVFLRGFAGLTISFHHPNASIDSPVPYEDFPRWMRGSDVFLNVEAFERFDEATNRGTLLHELLHVEQVQNYGMTDHGEVFHERASALGAPMEAPPLPRSSELRLSSLRDALLSLGRLANRANPRL